MKNTIRFLAILLTILAAGTLGACASQQGREAREFYDMGMLPAPKNAPAPPTLPPLSIAEIDSPAWLDSRTMFYRLAYANDQQPRPYASSRWIMPPADLFGQRLKDRIGQSGGAVLSASDGVINVPLLRIETDDFTQIFISPRESVVRVSVRASVLRARTLVAHRNFVREVPAPTPDASGGAHALAEASDAIITEMMTWLAGLPLKK